MRSSSLIAILLLGAGLALLVWGFSASDSLSSQTSELFQGAPSNKAIALMVAGVLLSGFGLVKLLRRSPA
jgi:threonine/homoserine/homoserine lactone efflux protein